MGRSKNLTFGRWAECRVFAELVKRGFDLYTPLVDDKGIDCIVRKEEEGKVCYLEIQIKARSRGVKHPFRFARLKIKPRKNYFFIFFTEEDGNFWIIPSEDLVKLAKRNKSGVNKGTYTIDLRVETYQKYLNDSGFNLLKNYPCGD
jgi:hypothetical protein